ncbi:hypothetical protein EZV62_007111 [Acer yangbiense]|uniref:FRIGIDA-like protein n=1 Tax=Acer yangbiense TaxID=1000413 RepID=A0A5C7IBP7_9ROSI|nr:hypothetical protein EZV62_007111 [Acer yangbiense]
MEKALERMEKLWFENRTTIGKEKDIIKEKCKELELTMKQSCGEIGTHEIQLLKIELEQSKKQVEELHRQLELKENSTDRRFLHIYLNDNYDKHNSPMPSVAAFAILQSPDLAKFVLEAIQGFYPPHLNYFDIEYSMSMVQSSCVVILEQFMKPSPTIGPEVHQLRELLGIGDQKNYGSKKNLGVTVPKWYQSLGMEERLQHVEHSVSSLSEGQQQILERITELFQRLPVNEGPRTVHEVGEGSMAPTGARDSNGNQRTSSLFHLYALKLVKLDFPRFNEKEDPTSWLCRVEQFFQFHNTLEEKKAGSLSHERQVSCFVSGLKDNINADVLAGRPNNLSAAIGLARLYEARNVSQKRMPIPELRKNVFSKREGQEQKLELLVKRLTPAELRERQEKGLCFKCNDMFHPEHRCQKLFLIEACNDDEDDDNDVVMEDDMGDSTENIEVLAISLHAIASTKVPESMRVHRKIGNEGAIVLIDFGSTHNFVSEKLAEKVGLQPIFGSRFEVVIASGEKLSSFGKCRQVILILQGFSILVDFYLLPLEGYGIVLGTQWLRTLGPIVWDFARLQMKFQINEKHVILQGISITEDKVIVEGELAHMTKKKSSGMVYRLFSLGIPDKWRVAEQDETASNSSLTYLTKQILDGEAVGPWRIPKNLPADSKHLLLERNEAA